MERLQRIIERLESKLQPLHDENKLLKTQLEDLQLDHELAQEQIKLLEDEIQGNSRVHELQTQIEALESLKRLSDELEVDQREEILSLEHQLASVTLALEEASAIPKSRPNDTLQHEIRLLKLDLEATQLALEAQKRGILEVLRDHIEFDLPRLEYELALCGSRPYQDRLDASFESWRTGRIGVPDLQEQVNALARDVSADLKNSPKVDAALGRTFLFRVTKDENVFSLNDTAVAQALEEPERIPELLASTSKAPVTAPKQVDPQSPNEYDRALVETLELKLEIATERALKASTLAETLDTARKNNSETQGQIEKLRSHIDTLKGQIQSKDESILELEAAQQPQLDMVTYQHTLGLLNDTIRLLHKKADPFTLDPLKVGPARNLSAFAGGSLVNQVWSAIDTFEKPKNNRQMLEQMRVLSLIDA